MNFDTHAAVKRLIAVGLQDRVAEEVVSSIALGRDYDFSKLVTKDEFLKFKGEVAERFNKIENEITLIKQEIKVSRKELKSDIEASRKEARTDNSALKGELKAEIDALRKEMEAGFDTLYTKISAEITKSKYETLRWIIGLFIALAIAIFIKH